MDRSLFDETPSPTAAWFTAHCDGGSRGNPGPSGYGAVIEDSHGQTVARLSQFLGIRTNNYAEYSGLLAVLEWALQNGARQMRVVSDSELMVNQMKGRYKVGSPGLRPLWEEAKRRAAKLERFEITHTLRGGNKEADRLANEAMDKGKQGSGFKDQGSASQQVSGSAIQLGSEVSGASGVRANAYERVPQVRGPHEQVPVRGVEIPRTWGPGKESPSKQPQQILDGYVKDGVVHLLNGELPEGTFVKITRE
ncbi:MAG: ribonuclease HI family protein [Terracidiphilus sp.]